jgi:hypothetical protein
MLVLKLFKLEPYYRKQFIIQKERLSEGERERERLRWTEEKRERYRERFVYIYF